MEAYIQSFANGAAAAARPASATLGCAVIVEPRRHPALRAVIANHRAMLPANWGIELWTAEGHRAWATAELSEIPGVAVRTLPVANLDQTTYSVLLCCPTFWASLGSPGHRAKAEWILVFQADTVMFRPLTEEALARWTRYDYTGANYYNPAETYAATGGIQGGFSLRRRTTMLRCLAEVSWARIDAARTVAGAPAIRADRQFEDIYFTHACALLGVPLPPIAERREFSIEAEYYVAPLAHHGWNRPYFTDAQVRAILATAWLPSPAV
jgi:hypothetical protein